MKSHKIASFLDFQNVMLVLILALIPSFFLHYRINGFITMLVIIVGMIQFTMAFNSIKKTGFILLMPILFLTLLFGQLYSDNLNTGWTLIERSLSLLLIPFALSKSDKLTGRNQKLIIYVFVVCGFITSLYCLGVQCYKAIESGSIYASQESTHFLYNRFMHHRLSEPIEMHAVYFSLFLALLAIYIFNQLVNSPQKATKRAGFVFLFLFFTVMILLLKSAIIVAGFCIIILYIIFQKVRSVRGFKEKFVLIGLSAIMILFSAYAIKSKVEFINLDYRMTDSNMGMIAIRLSIWESAWSVICQNWVMGVGTGDADLSLLNKYQENKFSIGFENDYNCHNMYLQYWLGNGIVAIVLFIGYLFLLLRKALNYKNTVFVGFVILFALFSLTESTMRVQKGMVFFMVMSSLFYWNPQLWSIKKEKEG